jgi:hypothetical protein
MIQENFGRELRTAINIPLDFDELGLPEYEAIEAFKRFDY